jgi:hypothetical protein
MKTAISRGCRLLNPHRVADSAKTVKHKGRKMDARITIKNKMGRGRERNLTIHKIFILRINPNSGSSPFISTIRPKKKRESTILSTFSEK